MSSSVVASGDYCDVADLVLEMREYRCYDITAAAKQVAQEIPSAVLEHAGECPYYSEPSRWAVLAVY